MNEKKILRAVPVRRYPFVPLAVPALEVNYLFGILGCLAEERVSPYTLRVALRRRRAGHHQH